MERADAPQPLDLRGIYQGLALWWPINIGLYWLLVNLLPGSAGSALGPLVLAGAAVGLTVWFWQRRRGWAYGVLLGYALMALTTSGTCLLLPDIFGQTRGDGRYMFLVWLISGAPLIYWLAVGLLAALAALAGRRR